MNSQDSLWTTLHQITSVKRQELEKQRQACKKLRKDLVNPTQGEKKSDNRVRLLLKSAGKTSKKVEPSQFYEILDFANISASNVQTFLDQAEYDASIGSPFFSTIEDHFIKGFSLLENKLDFAALFSDLVKQWSEQKVMLTSAPADGVSVGRKEMHEQRKEWEDIVFTPIDVDQDDLMSTLKEIFGRPEAVESLDDLRSSVEELCDAVQNSRVDGDEMKSIVAGLLSSDLLSDEQASILKQVQNNAVWMKEMVDVMNLRLSSIESWDWEIEAIPVEMRRQLNGKYRVFMHDEISHALLVYHIGIFFACRFAQALDRFVSSNGWKSRPGMSRDDYNKWQYFRGDRASNAKSVRDELSARYRQEYFMSSLPRRAEEGGGSYGDDALQDNQVQSRVSKAIEAQQSLLHLIVTESLMADQLEEELIVVQTDFRWFGPSLPHSTISTVMKFFGVTPTWLSLFDRFLCAPMRFIQDGPNGAIRRRKCGVPISHMLSIFFGEATLFCLDFAVNEATNGKPMFRLHDDIWFWGTSEDMINSWKTLTSVAGKMGLQINHEKTGAARLTRNKSLAAKPIPESLPSGALHWGLLNVQDEGRFTIDQAEIDEHITELKRQLGSRKSVFTWIQAYNSYMRFFTLKLCKPANALGRSHIIECMTTLSRINKELCPSTSGNVAHYIKSMIVEQLKVKTNIPDGFIFLPLALGGLELRNPFIGFQLQKYSIMEDPMKAFQDAIKGEVIAYNRLKKFFDDHGPANRYTNEEDDGPKEFMSMEEFKVYRREFCLPFWEAWTKLQNTAKDKVIQIEDNDKRLLNSLEGSAFKDYYSYWCAIVELYGEEIKTVFGDLRVVEEYLLPMGMINFCKSKVRWDS